MLGGVRVDVYRKIGTVRTYISFLPGRSVSGLGSAHELVPASLGVPRKRDAGEMLLWPLLASCS